MGLVNAVKVGFLKSYLGKLRRVDHGTTVAGTIAAVLLAGGLIDLNKLVGGGTQLEMAVEIGKAAAVLSFWFVMKLVGKPVPIDVLIAEAEKEEAQK